MVSFACEVMIHCGIKKIPTAHIMKRWTRDVRDYEYPAEVCPSATENLGQSLLYANALDAVKSTDNNKKAAQILNRYLNIARKEIDALDGPNPCQFTTSGGNTTVGYISGTNTEAETEWQSEYDSDGQPLVRNMYGASRSSAYMSDANINNIQTPVVPTETGRKRETMIKPLFERKQKARKNYTGSPLMYANNEDEGHLYNMCIGNDMVGKNNQVKKPKKTRKEQ